MNTIQETLIKNKTLALNVVNLPLTQEQWDSQAKLVTEAKANGECILKALGITIK